MHLKSKRVALMTENNENVQVSTFESKFHSILTLIICVVDFYGRDLRALRFRRCS